MNNKLFPAVVVVAVLLVIILPKTRQAMVCNTPADADCDGYVTRQELGSLLSQWASGSVDRQIVGNAITSWASNSYTGGNAGSKNLRFALAMYDTSFSASQIGFLNSNVDLVIVHENGAPSMSGYTGKLLMYKTAAWCYSNQQQSVCCYDQLSSSHEDWFVHSSSGSRLGDSASHGTSYWTYYGSSGWTDHSINDMNSDLASYSHLDGIFNDALQVEPGEIGGAREYSGEADMVNKLDSYMDQFNSRITREYWGNIAPYTTGGADYPGGAIALGKRLLDSADGVYSESFGIGWSGGWYSDSIIEQELQLMDYAAQVHKGVIMSSLSRYSSDDKSLVALYLLGKNDYTYWGFNEGGYNYGQTSWITSNAALISQANNLGQPTSARTKSGSVWTRQFEHGKVTFDMSTHKGTIQ